MVASAHAKRDTRDAGAGSGIESLAWGDDHGCAGAMLPLALTGASLVGIALVDDLVGAHERRRVEPASSLHLVPRVSLGRVTSVGIGGKRPELDHGVSLGRGRVEGVTLESMNEAALTDSRLERMSLEQWAELPEDEPGEIVDGYRVEEEVPENVHELVVAWLIAVLRVWGAPKGVLVLGSGAKFAVSKSRGRMPDVCAFLPGGVRPPRRGLNRQPPTIAVEVVSGTPRDARRDRVEKLREYAAFGVRWYWIVDPWLRSLQVHELDEQGRYVHIVDATDGVVERVPGCDGLTLDLTALWHEVDDQLADGEA